MAAKNAFAPDYAVPPGTTLGELLEDRGLQQSEVARRMGMAEKTLSQIVNGVAPISYETAEKLAMVLGVPASFWNRREMEYQEARTRLEANRRLNEEISWLKEIPCEELSRRKMIPSGLSGFALVRACLEFFGVSDVSAWRESWEKPLVAYRAQESLAKRPGFAAAWLRQGEIEAANSSAEPFSAQEFRAALDKIRGLTRRNPSTWATELSALCAAAGVVVVLTPEIPKAAISGATRWLRKDRALIQLSLKWKVDDQFWFTFFHEAGHVLLHGKKKAYYEVGAKTDEETEANAFARDQLIPPRYAKDLPGLTTKAEIVSFAGRVGIAPGIVVGRLHHDKLVPHNRFQDLKVKLAWSE